MNTLIKRLPLFAFVLAAGLAFGFNAPEILVKKTATKIWTPGGPLPHGYREVTAVVNAGDYDCDSQSQECIVEFSNDDPATGIKNVLDTGVFNETM